METPRRPPKSSTGPSRRTGAALVSAWLMAATVLLAAPGAAGATDPATPGALWGVTGFSAPPGAVDILESSMGRGFGAFADYMQLNQGPIWPDAVALRAMGEQALVFLNIQSSEPNESGGKTPLCWKDVAAGGYDPMLQEWVDAILESDYQSHLLISYNHEPNVSTPDQPVCDTDTPADYQAAYHHVHSFFITHGVTAPFAFVPSGAAYRDGVVERYLPPAADFSVIGTDAYNKVADPTDPKYRTPDQLLAPFFTWRNTNAPNKPMLIGELGEDEYDPNAPQWISDAISLIDSTPGVLAVDWNVRTDPGHPFSPLLNDASLEAWLAGVGAPSSGPARAPGLAFVGNAQQKAGEWPQFRGGPAHLGFNKKETLIGRKNVSLLTTLWSGGTGGVAFSSPAVSGGTVYVGSGDHDLYAFDALGGAGCGGSPPICQPKWTASTGGLITSSPAVRAGTVYVSSFDGKLYAFDALGSSKCGGSPKTCAPLWTADIGGAGFASPVVANGVVYTASEDGSLYAFNAAGRTNCSGNPKICLPLWTAQAGRSINSSPAVAGGVIYVGSDDHQLYAFDASGTVNCSGAPKTCAPLWTARTGDRIVSSPAVSGGVVYVGSDDFNLYAFDASGTINCSGSPTICQPLWSAATGSAIEASPAVAAGVVYVGSEDHTLYAFDSSGSVNCAGTPTVCHPLWSADVGGIVFSSPAVAHGVVYIGSNDRRLYAFDASGTKRCSGTPKVCNALVSIPSGDSVDSSPAIAGGVVYVGSNDRSVYAESLPGGPASGRRSWQAGLR